MSQRYRDGLERIALDRKVRDGMAGVARPILEAYVDEHDPARPKPKKTS